MPIVQICMKTEIEVKFNFYGVICVLVGCKEGVRDKIELNISSDWLRAGRPRGRSSSSGGGKNSLLSTSSRPVLGPTQPPVGTGVSFPGGKDDQSHPSNVKVKKTWIYTSTPPCVFMVLCLIS
jgi:hypothetical protein